MTINDCKNRDSMQQKKKLFLLKCNDEYLSTCT